MTNDQIALVAHIEAKNAKTQEWVDAAPGRWAGMITTDVDHWAGYGITTVAQYEHYMAVAAYVNCYKDINGVKPRWMNFDAMSTAEIEADLNALIERERGLAAVDAAAAEKLADELGHSVDDLKRWGVV
jgi:hypothetical protein